MNPYHVNEVAKHQFFQMPKILFYGKKYESLSAIHREAYMILLDRLKVSSKNNWVDEDGYIYFVYSNSDLCKVLKIARATLVKTKKKLQEVGLLKEIHTGRANRLYLLEPEIADEDEAKFLIHHDDLSGSSNLSEWSESEKLKISKAMKGNQNADKKTDEVQKVNFICFSASDQGFLENEKQTKFKNYTSEVQKLNTSKNNIVSEDNKDIKDLEIRNSEKINLSPFLPNSDQLNSKLEDELINFYISENALEETYGKQIIGLLRSYSFSDFEKFKSFCGLLAYSMKQAEDQSDHMISSELVSDSNFRKQVDLDLSKTFKSVMLKLKEDKIEAIDSYLFVSFKNVFTHYLQK